VIAASHNRSPKFLNERNAIRKLMFPVRGRAARSFVAKVSASDRLTASPVSVLGRQGAKQGDELASIQMIEPHVAPTGSRTALHPNPKWHLPVRGSVT